MLVSTRVRVQLQPLGQRPLCVHAVVAHNRLPSSSAASRLQYSTYDEVIDRANDNVYGLASAVVTKDLERAITISHALRAGVVWVNCYE